MQIAATIEVNTAALAKEMFSVLYEAGNIDVVTRGLIQEELEKAIQKLGTRAVRVGMGSPDQSSDPA